MQDQWDGVHQVTKEHVRVRPRGARQLLAALAWSLQGLRAAWQHESAFRLESYLALVLVPLGLWLGDGAAEKAILAGSIVVVLAGELVNSAIEAIVDMASPGYHKLAGRAKDMGSAAVLLLIVHAALCWLVILWPWA